MMGRYVSPTMSPEGAGELRARLAAREDELCRAYALLWQKQAALDEAARTMSELMTTLRVQQRELEALRSASDKQ